MRDRIAGRPVLVQRLQRLIIQAARFSEKRATTEADRRWAGLLLDGLVALLRRVE